MSSPTPTPKKAKHETANIAVIGAGWWSQGWHLPVLHNNPRSNLVAIVDSSSNPTSKLNPNLEPLSELAKKYTTKTFTSVTDLLEDSNIGPNLDGVLVATPHATHYAIGRQLLKIINQRKKENKKPLHILMEKPFTTDIEDAINLFNLVEAEADGDSQFWINHSANYRAQTTIARNTISSSRLGKIRHVTAYFASPLKWIFLDPGNDGWNKPTGNMIGNGFGWGQSSVRKMKETKNLEFIIDLTQATYKHSAFSIQHNYVHAVYLTNHQTCFYYQRHTSTF